MAKVDKQHVVSALLEELKTARAAAQASYESYKKDSIEAPGAMVSHSDTSKFQFGGLANEAAEKVAQLDEVIDSLPRLKSSMVRVNESGSDHVYLLVPEGAGGREVRLGGENIKTVSTNSPLGKALENKKVGDVAEFVVPSGKRQIKIVAVDG